MRPRPLVWALVPALVAAAACGSGGDGAQREQVEGLVRDYVAALVAGDGARACGLMTAAVHDAFAETAGAEGCAAGFRRAAAALGPRQQALLDRTRIDVDDIDGDRATVTIQVPGGLRTSVTARRVGGGWRFATPPDRF